MKINFSTDQQEHGVTMHANESAFMFIEHEGRELFLEVNIGSYEGEMVLLVSDALANNYVNTEWELLGRFFLSDFVGKEEINEDDTTS